MRKIKNPILIKMGCIVNVDQGNAKENSVEFVVLIRTVDSACAR